MEGRRVNPFEKFGKDLAEMAEATKFTAIAAPAYRGLKGTAADAVGFLTDEELAKSLDAITLMLHLLHTEDEARKLRAAATAKEEQHAEGSQG